MYATPSFSDDPNHLKGGWYVLELARRMEAFPVEFCIAGKGKLSGAMPQNVTLLGEIADPREMASQYANADVTLLASRGETFSMVTAESLCCGTPVVGFQCGGAEEIALPEFSRFVPFGNLDALEAAVKAVLKAPHDRDKCAGRAAARYALSSMQERYASLYRRLADEDSD